MNRIIIGALAHVDAGKTTLSEALLHHSGAISTRGRVDHQDAFLDFDVQEKEKGITIFSKEARFNLGDKSFIYVDTPGHSDLKNEVGRSIKILDYAIIVVSGHDSIPNDTVSIYSELISLNIPVILFVNKMDIAISSKEEIIAQIRNRFSSRCVPLEEISETVALNSEELLNEYLENGTVPDEEITAALRDLVFSPVFFGSALKEDGISELCSFIEKYTCHKTEGDEFSAYVYKITSFKGERLSHLKILSGTLINKSMIGEEKINEILLPDGNSFVSVKEVSAVDLCAIKGPKELKAGMWLPSFREDASIEEIPLRYRILTGEKNNLKVFNTLQPLNDEFPELDITLEENDLSISLKGELHGEIVRNIIKDRYDLDIRYSEPLIEYKERIREETYGVGHFEPLRHYGEAIVTLKPLSEGSGVKVKSMVDNSFTGSLVSYLNKYHPRGILTNNYLTDLEITIVDIKTHPKHTEGHDLVESIRRAIRQGLMKVESELLEPYYEMSVQTESTLFNRLIDLFSRENITYSIDGVDTLLSRIPVREFSPIMMKIKQITKGDLDIAILSTVYDQARNAQEVIARRNYSPLEDLRNPCGSVFTYNGAGHYIPYDEVEGMMHLELSDYFSDGVSTSITHNRSTISDDELKRVWNSLYKPKERNFNSSRKAYGKKEEEDEEERKIDLTPPKPLVYLIDGYNVLYALEGEKEEVDLMSGREMVSDLVCDFAGYVNARCILVFDAYKQENTRAVVTERDNIEIVYTRINQTADMYIEKTSSELKEKYKVIVVTSDRLEQFRVFENSSLRLSSREFLERYQKMRKNSRKVESIPNKPFADLKEMLEKE